MPFHAMMVFQRCPDAGGASIMEVLPMDELRQLLEGFREVLQVLVLVEGLVRSTIELIEDVKRLEEVRRRKKEHKH